MDDATIEREVKGLTRELNSSLTRDDAERRKLIIEQLKKRGVKIDKVEKAVKK